MAHEQPVRTRDTIEAIYQWRLSDIYAQDTDWENDFTAAKQAIGEMPALQASLTPDAQQILSTLQAADALDLQLERLYTYARMRRDEDSRDGVTQAMADRAESLVIRGAAVTAFLRPALLAMPESLLDACAKDPAFADYNRVLADILRSRPHTLPAEQEALLAEASEIGGAPDTIITMLTEADMTFPSITDSAGNTLEVSEPRYLSLLQSRDRTVRQAAFDAILGTYGRFGNTIASIYATSVKQDAFSARAHKFGSALEASLFGNEIPVPVYDALLTAVRERLPALGRYLQYKQRMLGLSDLHLYDLYVDTAGEFEMKLSYEEAYALVLEALAPLGTAYVDRVRAGQSAGWVDVYENVGKANGAYSWGPYGAHPYILMNFDGTLDGASTLAHELGHAMHSQLSNEALPHAKAGYTPFAAEVAPTVNEILLSTHLLAKYPERAAQQSLYGMLLEHFRTTVFRQTMFAAFEKKTHAMQERGEALTRDALCATYLDLNQTYYGSVCQVDDDIRNEWMRIPHFYRAFYVYQYATGFSAAVSIARRILREGQPAVDGYMRFLSSGGALPPLDALRLAGVDMATPGPVREALDWFEEILEKVEAL